MATATPALPRLQPSRRPDGDVRLFHDVTDALGRAGANPRRPAVARSRKYHSFTRVLSILVVAFTSSAVTLSLTIAVGNRPRVLVKRAAAASEEPDAAGLVKVDGGSAGGAGHLLVATVPLPATEAEAHDTVTRRLLREGAAMMRDSARAATRAASLCLGRPVRVTVDPHDVLGPSGGLMLALSIIDQSTPGDLTDGVRVAGSGVILPNGRVLPVLSVARKVNIAEHAGAEVFLVPAGQASEARKAAHAIRVVPVRSLSDAMRAFGASCVPQT
jgi:hypothetical protein